MINESTFNKMIEMRLTAMADAYRMQINDNSFNELSFWLFHINSSTNFHFWAAAIPT